MMNMTNFVFETKNLYNSLDEHYLLVVWLLIEILINFHYCNVLFASVDKLV